MLRNCLDCGNKVEHHSSKRCKNCAPIHTKKIQKEYRLNNKELCKQRTKNSQNKKKAEYLIKRREYYRKKHGIPLDDPFVKRKDGEGSIDAQGYKTITKKGHPNSMDERGRLREHVYIISEHLGRPLTKKESVHHKK